MNHSFIKGFFKEANAHGLNDLEAVTILKQADYLSDLINRVAEVEKTNNHPKEIKAVKDSLLGVVAKMTDPLKVNLISKDSTLGQWLPAKLRDLSSIDATSQAKTILPKLLSEANAFQQMQKAITSGVPKKFIEAMSDNRNAAASNAVFKATSPIAQQLASLK